MTAPVRAQSVAVAAMATDWPLVAALMGGTSAMREAGKTYLPQWPNETDASYKARKSTAVLHPAFKRTAEVLTSKPLSKAITLANAPKRIEEFTSNVDAEGRGLHAFASDLMLDCLSHGISGVLVDFPRGAQTKTKAQEQQAGARPYFVRYPPGTVLGWKSKKINGKLQLVQLRLLESETVEDGEFGETTVEQVRVLTPGAWKTYRASEKKPEEWIPHEEGVTTLRVIPFVFFYGIRAGFGIGLPPLLELAHQNVEHWQSASDQQTILHIARVPILFMRCFGDKTKLSIGSGSAVKAENEKAELKYVEHTGEAITAGRQSILDLEERMRQTGAEMLVRRSGKVTATQVRGEDDAHKSVLQRIVEVFEESIDQCLSLMALWLGDAGGGGTASLFNDFSAADLGEASAQFLLDMNMAGKLSNETLFNEIQRRDLISPEVKWSEEKGKLPPPVSPKLPVPIKSDA